MKNKRFLAVKFDDEEIKRSTSIKLDKDIFNGSSKNKIYYYEHIENFLQSKEFYDNAIAGISHIVHESLPKKQLEKCLCSDPEFNGDIPDNERPCANLSNQFTFIYFLAGQEFVNIVFNNKVIYEDKEALKELTWNFFLCFEVNQEIIYFDIDKLIKYTLNANFKALSNLFRGSEIFNYLKGINNTIDSLGSTEIENKLFNKEDLNYISLQKKFLENKRKYLKERLKEANYRGDAFIEKKEIKNLNLRPNRTDLAYFFYYLSQTNIKILKSVFPSDLAWNEIGLKFGKSSKNIQKAYNIINSNSKERLRKRKDNNIEYVIENMLKDYPKALKLAKDELKLAKLNT